MFQSFGVIKVLQDLVDRHIRVRVGRVAWALHRAARGELTFVPPGSRMKNLIFQSGCISLATDLEAPSRAHFLPSALVLNPLLPEFTYEAW